MKPPLNTRRWYVIGWGAGLLALALWVLLAAMLWGVVVSTPWASTAVESSHAAAPAVLGAVYVTAAIRGSTPERGLAIDARPYYG